MKTKHILNVLFALCLSLAVTAGCSDANAAESVYLPLYEPCPFAVDEAFDLGATGLLFAELEEAYFESADFDADDFDGAERDDDHDLYDDFHEVTGALFAGEAAPATLASQTSGGLVDLNHANVDELTSLPGIGPALAQRIIDYRSERPFTDVAQLKRVRGIGDSTLERIRPMVYVD